MNRFSLLKNIKNIFVYFFYSCSSVFLTFLIITFFIVFITFIMCVSESVFASGTMAAEAMKVIKIMENHKNVKDGENKKNERKAVGWHWYNEIYPEDRKDNKDEQEEEKQEEQEAQEKQNKEKSGMRRDRKDKKNKKENSAILQMSVLRRAVREAKAKAILYPTESNIRVYVILQNFVMGKAALFTQMWKKTLLSHPDLDYSILHPTQNSAQHILYAEASKKEDAAIEVFSRKYGLFFFYRGNNPLDQALAPTIKSFSKKHNISLLPVSVDGKGLSIFDDLDDLDDSSGINFDKNFAKNHFDSGQAKKLGINHFPALILVDPKNQKLLPLNYGYISSSELRRRFLQIATNFKEGV